MASSSSNSNPLYHSRSISLPSRPNPLAVNVDEQAKRLAAASSSVATAPSSSSSSSVSTSLSELRDLYDSINALLELPHTRQILSRENHKDQAVDGLLGSSLCFLDVCSVAKDALLQRREQAQDIQSVLRRKRGDESELVKESAKYLALEKTLKRAISKSLRDLKKKTTALSNLSPTFGMLREVEMASAAVLGSLLSFLSGQKAQSRVSSWSLMSKLMVSSKRVNPEESSEFGNVDSMLQALVHGKRGKCFSVGREELLNELRRMESSIQDLEEELESVLRSIIRTRAVLLNIFTN
ncbi:hypothetical protein SAY87_006241 [Trapa incisa]|uniref:Uncharacterized protein n=1 Tax=Trapa incisa TaxID=236973 RepID=A0AAN7KB91_9MYRT|nr:hypothetical protein SAY87_006241 [Trapa incisa]